MFQITIWHLFGFKPLSEAMLCHLQMVAILSLPQYFRLRLDTSGPLKYKDHFVRCRDSHNKDRLLCECPVY